MPTFKDLKAAANASTPAVKNAVENYEAAATRIEQQLLEEQRKERLND
jgi:hypothetical protein